MVRVTARALTRGGSSASVQCCAAVMSSASCSTYDKVRVRARGTTLRLGLGHLPLSLGSTVLTLPLSLGSTVVSRVGGVR